MVDDLVSRSEKKSDRGCPADPGRVAASRPAEAGASGNGERRALVPAGTRVWEQPGTAARGGNRDCPRISEMAREESRKGSANGGRDAWRASARFSANDTTLRFSRAVHRRRCRELRHPGLNTPTGQGDARTWLTGYSLASNRAERIHDTPMLEPYGHLLRSALAKRITTG